VSQHLASLHQARRQHATGAITLRTVPLLAGMLQHLLLGPQQSTGVADEAVREHILLLPARHCCGRCQLQAHLP
jgi:hypothetical protein